MARAHRREVGSVSIQRHGVQEPVRLTPAILWLETSVARDGGGGLAVGQGPRAGRGVAIGVLRRLCSGMVTLW